MYGNVGLPVGGHVNPVNDGFLKWNLPVFLEKHIILDQTAQLIQRTIHWIILSANVLTSGRRQSKTLSTIDERGSKIDRNNVFDCHLSPVRRQMAIENFVSNDFLSTFNDSIGVFDCRLPGVVLLFE